MKVNQIYTVDVIEEHLNLYNFDFFFGGTISTLKLLICNTELFPPLSRLSVYEELSMLVRERLHVGRVIFCIHFNLFRDVNV
jgi:hypothetical protein